MMLKKILVPLDGSKLAEKAIPYAQELVSKFDAELILTRVLQPMLVMSEYGVAFYNQQLEQEQTEAQTYLKTIKGELREFNLEATTEVLTGQPIADAIIDLACKKDVDLILMSTHGRSGISRWVYGSIASKVLQHAPCPIYLIRANSSK
jgi:nucleotide-binding universal stress UspA family protein